MPNLTLTATLSPLPANIWSSDPTFGNGTRHQVSAQFALPAHTYTAGTLVIKWHLATPYTTNWPYYFTLRVDANTSHIPFSLENGAHAWRQVGTSGGPGATLEDDYVLPGVWISYLNTGAGGSLTFLLNLDSTVQVPNSSTLVIDSAALTLTYADTPGSTFAKRWSAALVDGRALCAFVDNAGALQVSTSRSLKRGITAGQSAGWTTPAQIAPHAQDCNVGLHPGKGRAQLWYTQVDASNANPTCVYITSVTAGEQADWSAPTTILTPGYPYTYSPSTLKQPNSPFYQSGSWQYVVSQSSGKGADVGAVGQDGRLCWYPSAAYTVTAGASAIAGNALVCKDNGQGATWEWRDLTASGVFNSQDGAPPMTARDSDASYPGKAYGQTTNVAIGGTLGGVIARSAQVRADDGALYQLLFSRQYSRRAKIVPRVGTPTAAVGGNLWQNNVTNNPPTVATETTQYTLSVPAGTDPMKYIRLNWQQTLRERASVVGTLDSATKPTKVRFDIPALADIPAYNDLGNPSSPYAGSSYLYAWIELDCVYINAQGLQIAFTHDLTLGTAGQKYPVPQQAKTPLMNGRGEFVGNASWDYYGRFDIDRARSSTIVFDVLVTGQADSLNIKSAKLHIHNLQCETVGDTMTVASAMSTTTAASFTSLTGYGQKELFSEFTYPQTGYSLTVGTDASLLDEINGRQGNTWDFDLIWTQNNGLGATGSNKLLPLDTLFTDQYAQCLYPANPTDAGKGDFFLVRSRDNGLTWEYAADGKAIAPLSALRDWNNSGVDVKMPSLLTEDNIVFIIWVESSLVRMAASQDAGDTWTSA